MWESQILEILENSIFQADVKNSKLEPVLDLQCPHKRNSRKCKSGTDMQDPQVLGDTENQRSNALEKTTKNHAHVSDLLYQKSKKKY